MRAGTSVIAFSDNFCDTLIYTDVHEDALCNTITLALLTVQTWLDEISQ